MLIRTLLAAALAVTLIAAPAAAAPQRPAGKVRLKAFDSCSGLVRYARRNTVRTMRSQFLRGTEDSENAASGGESFSRTNVQEQGVDEPDIVKTNGTHAFAIAGSALHSIDVQAATPVVLDSLQLEENGSHELLLHGNRVLVISYLYGNNEVLGAAGGGESTRLVEIDVSDPSRLRRVNSLDAEGGYLSARLTGPTARIILRGTPRALYGTRAAVRRARLAKWMPRGVLTDRATGSKETGRLVACRSVRRPAAFGGVDMMTVLTVDLEQGLPAVDSDGLMTDADTVYASTGSLYVATQRWSDTLGGPDLPDGVRTAIHRFDASERGTTSYVSSGEVRGYLVSQWALSEHAGHLRVASTSVPPWWGEGADESESYITVLREDGPQLTMVGRVGGLGRGEQIYAVRFIGDVGYVVTFRQVDPLYTVDLATPTAPKVLGELKIRGYSAYLHPVGEDLLLGVGQDATRQGRQLGTQLSLFDVSDLSAPQRLHQVTLAGGSSEVEYDHHAFLYWPATGLTVLPLQEWKRRAPEPTYEAAGFRVDSAGIVDLGRLEHPVKSEWRGQIRRALVVGERLLTVSEAGILASPLDTMSAGAWVRFPRT